VEKSELTFTATATDPDIPANTFTFSLEDGDAGSVPAGASITLGGLFTWTPDAAGTFTFDVCVSDGALEDCETINVTVTEAGLPPDVSAYHGEIHFMEGDNEPEAENLIYAYRDDESAPAKSATITFDEPSSALVYSIDVEKESGGADPQNITFKIGDRVVATSDWESMRSKHLDIHPPKADAGGPYAVLLEDETVTLAGSATDWLDTDTFSYAWDFDGDGEFDDASGAAPVFSFTTVGTYEVGLRVTDGQGGEGYDTAQVFVVELLGLEGQVYNGDPHAVTGDGVEDPYTYSVLYGSPGSEIAPTDAGTYQITVVIKEGGDTVAEIESQLVISPKPLTVTADAQSKVYGDDDPALTYTVPDGSLIGSDAISGTLVRAEGNNVGTYAINQGNLSAGSNYTITFVSADLTITAKPITVTTDAQSKVYGDDDPDLTYTLSEGSLVGEDAISGELERAEGNNVGTYAISQGSLSAGDNYSITFEPATLTITPKPITVTAHAKSKVFGEDDPELTYSVAQGSLVNGDDFSGALVREPGEEVGVYEITQGDLTAGDNYAISFESASLTITLMSVTVTADSNQTKVYGEEDPVFTFTASEPLEFTGALSRVTGEDVGSYTIEIGDLSAGSNYTINFVSADFTITPKPITVTADSGQSKVYGSADPAFTYGSSEDVSFTGALSRVAGENVGGYAIEIGDLSAGDNYSISFISADFTITPKPITVTADSDQSKVYGAADSTFTYSSSEDVSFTGALSRVAGEDAGSYAIEIGNLSAGSNYTIAFVSADFTITPKPIMVTADSGQSKVYGSADPIFTYSSSEEVSFTGALSRVAGEDAGSYAIEIGDLSAGDNYFISLVSANFTITPKPITVTADDRTKGIGEGDPEWTYQITDGSLVEGDEFTGALTRESGEDAGEYAIQRGTLALSGNYTLTFIEGTLTILQEKHGIDLVAGWNLVSFSVHPTDTEIEEVLSSIDGLYTLVYAWDATTDSWLKFDPNVGYGRTLTDLDETMGFWIYMTADATLEVQGASPGSTEIALVSGGGGWNLVGFPSTATLELPGALEDHGVGDTYTIVFAYKAPDTADPWKLYEPGAPGYASDLTYLEAGWGYWIKVTEDVVWQVEY